jgi:GNAT superfamily N-acetyltransferase
VTVSIRLARFGDAAHLPAVERSAGELFRTLPELAWLASGDAALPVEAQRRLIARGRVWVAEIDGGGIVAFLSAERQGGTLYIVELSVMQEHQRAGIGKALIKTAADWARSAKLKALTLTTFHDVAWNGPYYQHLGFVRLANVDLAPHLAKVLAKEIEHGLPGERRCAMRMTL